MKELRDLLENNRRWAENKKSSDPEFFTRLVEQQSPAYLWIGCSDSRVPANQIVGLAPGEIFVHRNVANLVQHSDMNCLSVLQFAVDVLKVRHIIVTGHYGCGGVRAAMEEQRLGLVDNWLRPIQHTSHHHRHELAGLDDNARLDRLCELNVAQQVKNLCNTTIVLNAWSRNQPLSVHGWVYSIRDGLVRNLNVSRHGGEA